MSKFKKQEAFVFGGADGKERPKKHNLLDEVDIAALEQQLARRFYRKESKIAALDLIILSKGELIKILRYKK